MRTTYSSLDLALAMFAMHNGAPVRLGASAITHGYTVTACHDTTTHAIVGTLRTSTACSGKLSYTIAPIHASALDRAAISAAAATARAIRLAYTQGD